METSCAFGLCPFSQISWLWYVTSVIVTFLIGALWYGWLFSKPWIKAVQYKCNCGADLSKGEKCTCKQRSLLPMVIHFIALAMVGLTYFVLTSVSVWLSVFVVIAISAWMKSALKFQIADWKRYMIQASIDVGYFGIVSIIFILFASI